MYLLFFDLYTFNQTVILFLLASWCA